MTPSELRRRIRALIDGLEPTVQDAFTASIDDIRSSIVLEQVVDALTRNDVEAALLALNIEASAFAPLHLAIEAAYSQGGALAVAGTTFKDRTGHRVVVRWDVRNLRAEANIRRIAGDLIRYVTEDTKQAARAVILNGYTQGQGPKTIALDISGRINRVTGRREGGIIGLTPDQIAHSESFRARLTSGDPVEMNKALEMKLRDKRFDRTIAKAIAAGTPISKADADIMVARYRDKALKLRAETIARTETGAAVMAAKHEGFRQGLDKTGYTEAAVVRTWKDSRLPNVRDTHRAMNNQKVQGLSEPFVSPSGARLMHPMDRSLGAGISEIANCACDEEITLDYSIGLT